MKNSAVATVVAVLTIISVTYSCQNATENKTAVRSDTDSSKKTTLPTPLREKVLTAEEQKALTPDVVIQSLLEGNKRYMNNDLTARDHSAMVRNATKGQYP